MEKSNIKGYQRITANILYTIKILNTFLKFQKVYKNSFQVFIDYLTNNVNKENEGLNTSPFAEFQEDINTDINLSPNNEFLGIQTTQQQ